MTTVLLRHFLGAERVCRSASEGEPPSPEALLLKHSCGDHQVTSWLHTSSLEVQKRKKGKKNPAEFLGLCGMLAWKQGGSCRAISSNYAKEHSK